MPVRSRFPRFTIAAAALAAMTALPVAANAQSSPEQFSATAIDMTATSPGRSTAPVNITVTRWSTDEERDRLLTTLLEQGEKALLGVLQDMPRSGSIAPSGGVGFEVRFARREPTPSGGERIILLTERPMSFWERRDAGRSTEYPFTLVEMRLGPNGEGDGRVAAASIVADKRNNTIVVENYSDQPIRLQGVRRLGK